MEKSSRTEHATSLAIRIAGEAWDEIQRRPSVQEQLGNTSAPLPDVSLTEAQRRSGVGRDLLSRLAEIDEHEIPHDLALTLRLVRYRAHVWSREADWYWTVIDPLGEGYFGIFLPSAYCGSPVFNNVNNLLARFRFSESADQDRYLGLIADYARLVHQFAERTAGQADRGILAPKVQVPHARAVVNAFKSKIEDATRVDPQRLGTKSAEHFTRELEHRVATQLEPSFDRLLETLGERYLARAPDRVGMGQYEGGSEVYAELVKLQTTLSVTPQEVHDRALTRLANIEHAMQAIRAELGFKGDGAAFLKHLESCPEWRADNLASLNTVFDRYIARVKPVLAEYFSVLPHASYGVAPLPEGLQGSMTFGYYDMPTADRRHGRYVFNSKNLTSQPVHIVGPLTYHELMPGHHLQISIQQESRYLHPFRAYTCINAYVEGWAEYAANLAGEAGLYERAEERYGRLVMEALLACRSVVDTGMNALGWSLEEARDYMRVHSGRPEAEVRSESLRCSCDIPGQVLAYTTGDVEIRKMRERMRASMGEKFNIKEFHAAVLEPGGLPFPDVAWHLDWEIERLKGAA